VAVTVGIAGARGTDAAKTVVWVEAVPSPTKLTALTQNTYDVPAVTLVVVKVRRDPVVAAATPDDPDIPPSQYTL
jgi:hypothetical protein